MEVVRNDSNRPFMLSATTYNRISDILADLAAKTRAEAIIFCDTNGNTVTYRGQILGLKLSTLSALAAGNFSATREMAKLIDEPSTFRFLLLEGDRRNIYLSNVGHNFLLVTVFDKEVALGMVRVCSNRAIDDLKEVLDNAKAQEDKTPEFLDAEFRSLLSQELDLKLKS
jgi:predicted regulator of Ras-like GTPase activity (Roadblock/LC7/MglB family)